MIKQAPFHKIQELCEKRGYSFADIENSIISIGLTNLVTIDTYHPSYPRPKELSHSEFISTIENKE
jgi:hypothetical protein